MMALDFTNLPNKEKPLLDFTNLPNKEGNNDIAQPTISNVDESYLRPPDSSFFDRIGNSLRNIGLTTTMGVQGIGKGVGTLTKVVGKDMPTGDALFENPAWDMIPNLAIFGTSIKVGKFAANEISERFGTEGYEELKGRVNSITGANSLGSFLEKQGENIKTYFKDNGEYLNKFRDAEIYRGSFMENPSATRTFSVVAGAIPSLAAATAVTLATGNPGIGGVFLGFTEGADVYEKAIEAGKTHEEARNLLAVAGVGISALETISLGTISRTGLMGKVMGIALGAGKEGATEGLQQVYQNTIVKYGIDRAQSLMEGVVESIIAGAGSGGVISSFVPAQEQFKGYDMVDVANTMAEVGRNMEQNADEIDMAIVGSLDERQAVQKKENLAIEGELPDLVADEDLAQELGTTPEIIAEAEQIDDDFFLDETEDTYFEDFNDVPVYAESKPSKTVEKYMRLESRDAQRKGIQESLRDFVEIRKEFKGTIKADEGSTVEYESLPNKYKSEQGQTFDQIASELEQYGYYLETSTDVFEFFADLDNAIDLSKKQIIDLKPEMKTRRDTTIAKDKVKVEQRIKTAKEKAEVRGVKKGVKEGRSTVRQQMREDRRRAKAESKVKKTINKLKKAKLNEEIRDELEFILDKIDTQKLSDNKAGQLQSLVQAAKLNPLNIIPDSQIDNAVKRLNAKSINELTGDELQSLQDILDHIVHISQEQELVRVGGILKQHKVAVNDTLNEMNVNLYKKEGDIDMNSLDSTLASKTNLPKEFFGVQSWNLEFMSERLGDTTKKVFYDGIDKGVTNQLRFEQEARDFLDNRLKGIDQTGWSIAFETKAKNVIQEEIEFSNGKVKLTPHEKIALYLHSLNKKNRKHLMNGGIVFANRPEAKAFKFTREDIAGIQDNLLSADEMTVAETIYDYFNTVQNKKINEVSRKLLGVDLAREKDYFAIRTSFLDRVNESLLKSDSKSFVKKSLEGMGVLKERQSSSNAIVLEDAAVVLTKSVKNIGAYVGFAEPMKYARALLNDNKFQRRARELNQEPTLKEIEGYLDRIEGNSLDRHNIVKLVLSVINKLDKAILSLNLFVVAKQPISVMAAATEIDGKYLRANLNSDFKLAVDEMTANSPQLRNRVEGNISREMGELGSVGEALHLMTGKKVHDAKLMKAISLADTKAITIIWNATKQKINETTKLEGEKYWQKVTEEAERIVRLTQPTFNLKDRSPLASNINTFTRIITRFGSQRNKNYIMMNRAINTYNRSAKTKDDMKEVFNKVVIIAIYNSLGVGFVDNMRKLIKGKSIGEILQGAPMQFISSILGNVYGVGPAFELVMSKAMGKYSYDISNPFLDWGNELLGGIGDILGSAGQYITGERYVGGRNAGEKKWSHSLNNGVKEVLTSVGMGGYGVPVKNVEFWYKTLTGKKKQSNKF